MNIEKKEFENIKAALAGAINGSPLPSFKALEALQLIEACGRLASSNNAVLLSALGVFALARLVEMHRISAIAERELALLLPTISKQ